VTLQHTPGSTRNKATSSARYGTATSGNNNNSFTGSSAVDDGTLSGLLPQALDMFELAHVLGHATAEKEVTLLLQSYSTFLHLSTNVRIEVLHSVCASCYPLLLVAYLLRVTTACSTCHIHTMCVRCVLTLPHLSR
jgi:hypothetical protein